MPDPLEIPVAFHDLPADNFPFVITGLVDGEPVWEQEVTEPGSVRVPSLGHLGPVTIRVRWGNGTETVVEP